MQIEVTADDRVTGREQLTGRVQSIVERSLRRFGDRVTWVEVHLGDENRHKSGSADKWCGLHAKLAGLPTVNVNAQSSTLDQAIDLATDKLLKVLERTLGKDAPKKRSPMNGEPGL